jgi:hypothetical protein
LLGGKEERQVAGAFRPAPAPLGLLVKHRVAVEKLTRRKMAEKTLQ